MHDIKKNPVALFLMLAICAAPGPGQAIVPPLALEVPQGCGFRGEGLGTTDRFSSGYDAGERRRRQLLIDNATVTPPAEETLSFMQASDAEIRQVLTDTLMDIDDRRLAHARRTVPDCRLIRRGPIPPGRTPAGYMVCSSMRDPRTPRASVRENLHSRVYDRRTGKATQLRLSLSEFRPTGQPISETFDADAARLMRSVRRAGTG